MTPRLVTYQCPRCGDAMPALEGGEISHACTHNRNRVTVWTVVDDDREQVDA